MVSLFLANAWGWLIAHWRIVAAVGGVLILVLVVNSFCNKKPSVKIDNEAAEKLSKQNEADRKKDLQVIVEANADKIKTVDERTELQNINVVERNREIDAKVEEVNKKIEAEKAKGGEVTSEELQCILVPADCK
jgi:uncharacterized membrane protein YhiD involved in acid resistance